MGLTKVQTETVIATEDSCMSFVQVRGSVPCEYVMGRWRLALITSLVQYSGSSRVSVLWKAKSTLPDAFDRLSNLWTQASDHTSKMKHPLLTLR